MPQSGTQLYSISPTSFPHACVKSPASINFCLFVFKAYTGAWLKRNSSCSNVTLCQRSPPLGWRLHSHILRRDCLRKMLCCYFVRRPLASFVALNPTKATESRERPVTPSLFYVREAKAGLLATEGYVAQMEESPRYLQHLQELFSPPVICSVTF